MQINSNGKKMNNPTQVQALFIVAQVRVMNPLKEFSYPTWAKVPKHGIKSITPVGDNSCPSNLGYYFYEVEACFRSVSDINFEAITKKFMIGYASQG